ncbi:hypothetical protein [Mycoplasma sp. Z244C]
MKEKSLYPHEANLLNKISSNYHGKKDEINDFYRNQYIVFRNKISELNQKIKNEEYFISFSNLCWNYYADLVKFIKENKIKSQSKMDSSFLEELSIYLFEDLDLIHKNSFTLFNKKIFAGLKISDDNFFDIVTKDVDFCIGRKIDLKLSSKSKEIIFPLISVEVKTYVDATMLGEIMSDAIYIFV